MKSSIEIAQAAKMKPIAEIARQLGLSDADLEPYGHYKAKVSVDVLKNRREKPDGRLVLVSAVTPTPSGEGKSTTTVGLGMTLNRLKKRAVICLREPSLGPCFGIKGGAAGGGYAQVVPMEDINLHFTGDLHAVTSAHNLLAAVLDNHLHHGNARRIDPRQILWRRVMDMNERTLRQIVIGLGGKANGVPRESGFDITVASELMAILCLSNDIKDLRERVGRVIIGFDEKGEVVRASDLNVHGAVTALMKDALSPNLVQTLENTAAFVHGGPFANIAHGCNSVLATKTALKLADYVVTEAGFGFDLGGEKFLDIKCPYAGLKPACAVLVATVRALKMHGGMELKEVANENLSALRDGLPNLEKHLENIRLFGLPPVVAINHFPSDTQRETDYLLDWCREHNVPAAVSDVFNRGSDGGMELAETVLQATQDSASGYRPLYRWDQPVRSKIEAIAGKIYGADSVAFHKAAQDVMAKVQQIGCHQLPICVAKTQYSLSDNPKRLGRPKGFEITVRELRISAGAGFLVAITGEIMTMPGLPKTPAAENITVDDSGRIHGLF